MGLRTLSRKRYLTSYLSFTFCTNSRKTKLKRLRHANIIIKDFEVTVINLLLRIQRLNKLIIARNIISFLCSILLFISCGQDAPTSTIIEESTLHLDTITLKGIKGLKPSLRLTPAAQEATKDWRTYGALAKMMDAYKEISFLELKENVDRGVGLFTQEEQAEEAAVSIFPESMNTPAIKSRFLVVETRIKVLQNLVLKNTPDTSAIETEMVHIQNAFQDLNLQINERFGKSVEELLEELRKAQEATDTVVPNQNPQGRPPLAASQQL
jgi:hypothetical protein